MALIGLDNIFLTIVLVLAIVLIFAKGVLIVQP